jgi:hypothetical protein
LGHATRVENATVIRHPHLRRGIARAAVIAGLAAVLLAPSASTAAAATTTVPATWLSDEQFYLALFNCTRSGGWVQANGSCTGYGTGRYSAYVRPIPRSATISNLVSRPYAQLLAVRNGCSHYLDGDPGSRLRRAGFRPTAWGENIACYGGYPSVRAAIIAGHRAFQAEKSTNGGHWRNIKNARYTSIGIGIWKVGTRVRLVTDFHRP